MGSSCLILALASNLQAKALNAGKYGVSKKNHMAGKQMPGQQRLKSFKEKATDGTTYLANKLKSLNGHMPAQHVASNHHGQINEITGKKTNKLKINPALKQRLLQNDPPMTMSTKPLSKGMPPRDSGEESSSAPMGFGARTRDRINMFKNINKLSAAAPSGATAASAGGAGRSNRRQNLVPRMNQQEARMLGSSGRRNQQLEEQQYDYDYTYPDQSLEQPKPSSLKTVERKSPNMVVQSPLPQAVKAVAKPKEVQTTTTTPETQLKPEETDDNPNKEHIFIPRKVYRPRPSKKTSNQTEPAGTMTQQSNEVVQPNAQTKTVTDKAATSTTATVVEEAKTTTQKPETVNQETITELKAKKVESQEVKAESQRTPKEEIVPLKAVKVESQETPKVIDPPAAADQLTPEAEQQIVQEVQAESSQTERLVQEEAPVQAEEKEVRLLPINLQNLNAQLTFEHPDQIQQPEMLHEQPIFNTFLPVQSLDAQEQLAMPQDHLHALYQLEQEPAIQHFSAFPHTQGQGQLNLQPLAAPLSLNLNTAVEQPLVPEN